MYSYRRRRTGEAPCHDVSWHPHYPVLASTSFDSTVKIWTHQTKQEETKRQEEEPLLRQENQASDEEEEEDSM